jgi:hypothetical protein
MAASAAVRPMLEDKFKKALLSSATQAEEPREFESLLVSLQEMGKHRTKNSAIRNPT